MANTNPIPGMNPWLEAHWGDVHTRLTMYASDQLQPQLPEGLRARVEEYVSVESFDPDDDRPTRYAPDVRVVEHHSAPEPVGASGAAVATEVDTDAEPVVVRRLGDPETLHRIEILDMSGNERVVTSIEFISLPTKRGKGREAFMTKQLAMLDGDANIVEIDLLRDRVWVMAIAEAHTPRRFRGPYRICVVRAAKPHLAELYRADFRRPLPSIKIPLREGDDDVRLELQPLIDAAYVNGRYGDEFNYKKSPQPELSAADAEWVAQHLREAGLLAAGDA